jgi:hypothetical protein
VIAVGCSGGSGPDPLSKGEFLRQAEGICRSAAERVAAIDPPSLSDSAAVERAIGELLSIQRAALADLRALPPPEADVPGVEEWLDAVDATLDQIERAKQGLHDGDGTVVSDANTQGASRNNEAEQLAFSYGLRDCAGSVADELTSVTTAPPTTTAP